MAHAHSQSVDYGHWTKMVFLFGLGLFLFGVGGEILGHAIVGPLPAWENTLFTYAEGIGLVIWFFTPWIGGALILTD